MSNDPSTDERVLKDAQRTIERIVEAMKTALDDELAVQQMEYDQVFGVNSMQFAMYQTLVMTFFQDHQMLASLNLKRTRPDLSHGVPEQKRAYLMEVIAERVSSAVPPAVQQQSQSAGQNSGMQVSEAWQQQPQPAPQAPAANWLDPQPAAPQQPAPGDWLNQPTAKERPPATAWPTNEDSSTWTLKPGGGQPPAIPANSANGSGAAWAPSSNSWPTPEDQKQGQSSSAWPTVPEPAQVIQSENNWPGSQTNTPGWADQPGAKQAPPAAAWPASNSGAAPAPSNAIAMPQPPVAPPGVTRPDFNTPIGESGMSGTWTLPPKPDDPPAPAWDGSGRPSPTAAPPAPAWGEPSTGAPQPGSNGNYGVPGQPTVGQLPAAAWSTPATPSQEMSAWNQPTPAPTQGLAATPPAPAWSAPGGAMPTPEGSSNQTIQPWQNRANGGPQQPWQPEQPQPAWQAPPASVTQSGLPAQPAAVTPPAWEAPPASITQAQPAPQQPWQSPPANQQWQQPTPQPQMQQPAPVQQQPPAQQPWQTPGTISSAGNWANQPAGHAGQQPYPPQPAPSNQMQNQQMPYQQMPMQGAPQMQPVPPSPMQQMPPIPTSLPAPQEQQGWTPPDSPWGGAEGNGAAPWSQNGMPPQAGSPPTQYPSNNGQPDPYQNQQGQYPSNGQGQYGSLPPQAAPNQQMPAADDMSINFSQNNQPPQNTGGTLSGVLRQMRNADNKPKREEEERQDNYNPNTAW